MEKKEKEQILRTFFGVNFLFKERKTSELERLFDINDTTRLFDFGIEIEDVSLKRALKINNKLLNLKIDLSEKTILFNLNFHFPINNYLSELKENLALSSIVSLKELSFKLLKETYDLQLTN
ncbi:MAG: hypothetical protein V1872_04365 [bacterium]